MPYDIYMSVITCSYEPEIHPGVTYKIKDPKATLKIFSTGSITVTGVMFKIISYIFIHSLVYNYITDVIIFFKFVPF